MRIVREYLKSVILNLFQNLSWKETLILKDPETSSGGQK